jgi:hypothetical protein
MPAWLSAKSKLSRNGVSGKLAGGIHPGTYGAEPLTLVIEHGAEEYT